MNRLLAMLMTVFVLSMPVVGFWHPPLPPVPPSCTYMGTLINDQLFWNFTESGHSGNFKVTVYIAQVTDMYGYEFKLAWDPALFELVSWSVATDVWSAQAIIFNGTVGAGLYRQVVTALPPSEGVDGDFKLVDLDFHIVNYPCPGMPGKGAFNLVSTKVGNSCSGVISLCSPVLATWEFKPDRPTIWIEPAELTSSIVGEKNTISVMLKNAVGVRNFLVRIKWNDYLHGAAECNLACLRTTLLTTDEESVVLNTDLFDESTAFISVYSPPCGIRCLDGYVYVAAHAITPIDLVYSSGSIWLFNVTFTKCDPWYCGAQPPYTLSDKHLWIPANASTPICFDVARVYSACGSTPKAIAGKYTFVPIAGDLDGSGLVDVADLMIEASYYGLPVSCNPAHIPAGGPPNGFTYFYDLNHDGFIDVYDLIIVAKNTGKATS